jgi:hypothetical protein
MKWLPAALLAAGLYHPPATISGVLSGGNAHISVRFQAEGSDVQIALRAADGMKLLGEEIPIRGRSVSKAERIAIDVPYQQGPDQSSLTVEVTGTFDGESKTVSQSFKVGIPNDDQRHQNHDRAMGKQVD